MQPRPELTDHHSHTAALHLLWEHFPNEPKVKKTQSYSCICSPLSWNGHFCKRRFRTSPKLWNWVGASTPGLIRFIRKTMIRPNSFSTRLLGHSVFTVPYLLKPPLLQMFHRVGHRHDNARNNNNYDKEIWVSLVQQGVKCNTGV